MQVTIVSALVSVLKERKPLSILNPKVASSSFMWTNVRTPVRQLKKVEERSSIGLTVSSIKIVTLFL